MGFTLDKIELVMTKAIIDLENKIGHSGSHSQAASFLKENLKFFMIGIENGFMSMSPMVYDPELEIEIPEEWYKYFKQTLMESDSEYEEFVRLSEKFEKLK